MEMTFYIQPRYFFTVMYIIILCQSESFARCTDDGNGYDNSRKKPVGWKGAGKLSFIAAGVVRARLLNVFLFLGGSMPSAGI